jgi:hypothetical protein
LVSVNQTAFFATNPEGAWITSGLAVIRQELENPNAYNAQ